MHRRLAFLPFLCSLAFVACDGDGTAPRPITPSRLVAEAPGRQVVLPAMPVFAPAVRVTDSAGRATPGVAVRFVETDGAGFGSIDAVTDDDGLAGAAAWSLGRLGRHRVRAQLVPARGEPLVFEALLLPREGPLAMDARCPVPDSIAPVGWALPRVAQRLRDGESLRFVAIGSSSTVGAGASVPDSAYPLLLLNHLRRLYPGSLTLGWNAGIGGQNLRSLRARFDADVFAHAPDLVVLQTGTIDAMQNASLGEFEAQLREAIGALRARAIDVVLLDSQRYPGTGETAHYQAVQALMLRLAGELGVPVVRRYAWMWEMMRRETYGNAELLSSDVFHPSDLTYSCTARLLADGLARSVAGTVAAGAAIPAR